MIRRFVLTLISGMLFVILASGVYYTQLISDAKPSAEELVIRTKIEKFLYRDLGFTTMGGAWKYVREVDLDKTGDKATHKYVVFGRYKGIDFQKSTLTIVDNDSTEYQFRVNLITKDVDVPEAYLPITYIGKDKIPTIQDILVVFNGKVLERTLLDESDLISVYWNDDSYKKEVVSEIFSGTIIDGVIEISTYDY